MSTFFSSLRTRITIIVLTALLPAWTMMLFSISQQRAMIQSDVLKESLRAAELAAGSEEQVIEGTRQVLTTLHFLYGKDPTARTACVELLLQQVSGSPRYAGLGVVSRGGEIVSSTSLGGSLFNVADSPWFQMALRSKEITVGDYPVGESAEKPALVVTDSVLDSNNQVEAVLFAAIDLDWLDDFCVPRTVESVEGAFFALVDRDGMVLSRHPNAVVEFFPLRQAALLDAMTHGGSNVLVTKSSTGADYIYAVSPIKSQSPSRTISVVLGMPADAAFAEANHARNLNLLLLGGVSTLMVFGFWMSANSVILRRLDGLFAAARSLTTGDLKVRSGLVHHGDELAHFAKAFDEMAEALERREREHREAEATIRQSEDQLRRLQAHVQQVREEEQLRLAREIHDELGQALTALRIDVSWLEKRSTSDDPQALKNKLNGMARIIDAAMDTAHHVSSELRPRILDDLGLGEAIEWQAEEFQRRTGMACEVVVGEDHPDLSQEQATGLFRIFQEALTNAARHSDGTRVEVSLEMNSETVVLTISDDGKGIRSQEIESPLSYGLLGIRERVNVLAGSVEIFGHSGVGTTLKVSVPRHRKSKE